MMAGTRGGWGITFLKRNQERKGCGLVVVHLLSVLKSSHLIHSSSVGGLYWLRAVQIAVQSGHMDWSRLHAVLGDIWGLL